MTTRIALLAVGALSICWGQQSAKNIETPRIWNDASLAEWATPLAKLKVRPSHFTERDYYAAPNAEWVRTYPVYFPGREPAGYDEMLQSKKPEPLITPGGRTKADWVAAGKRVFEEMDVPAFRSDDPKIVGMLRSAEAFTKAGGRALKDGTVFGIRWIPTSKGLMLTLQDCAGCHTRIMPDGSRISGAPNYEPFNGVVGALVNVGDQQFFKGESPQMANWRTFATPWIENDIHEQIKSMQPQDLGALFQSNPPGTFPRFNGSPFFTTKMPDLIGMGERKYIDHTATHRMRDSADIARYAAVVSCCDSADFGSHRMLSDKQRVIDYRMPDELLFAVAEYISALQPPTNPNPKDAKAAAGKKVFEREACGTCHPAPLYTNNKLTPAVGYTVPADHPYKSDIMPISVGTDPNLALKTRKGTGLYKVPSLKGVWYRGMFNHDGSVTRLEEWFDPARLHEDFVPSGFKGYKVTNRAVPGHEFGLKLSKEDKAALIAFLKTL